MGILCCFCRSCGVNLRNELTKSFMLQVLVWMSVCLWQTGKSLWNFYTCEWAVLSRERHAFISPHKAEQHDTHLPQTWKISPSEDKLPLVYIRRCLHFCLVISLNKSLPLSLHSTFILFFPLEWFIFFSFISFLSFLLLGCILQGLIIQCSWVRCLLGELNISGPTLDRFTMAGLTNL